MSWFHYFVLSSLSLVTIISIFMALKLRIHLKKMAGMMISMAIGMNSGLTAGILFGSFYQGDLYYSTILSIFIGALFGMLCGVAFGALPTIEGFMAGMMGGMMGAMLGEMITFSQANTLIKIFLTLSVCTLLLFPILHEPQVKKINNNNLWVVKPLLTFIFLVGYLVLGNQLDKHSVQSKNQSSPTDDHNHISENNAGQSKHPITDAIKELTIDVHPSSFSYAPQNIILKKGQKVRLKLTNHDSIDHDLEIKHFPVTLNQENHHDGHKGAHEADFHLHSKPNSQSATILTPLQSGIYEFYCTISGHKENGMVGKIIVE